MKSVLHRTSLSVIVVLFICVSCSKNNDIVIKNSANMFKKCQSIKMMKKIDYVGFSFHHEIYDIRTYHVVNGEIDSDFCFDVLISTETIPKNSWLQCGVDNPTTSFFPMFDTKNEFRKGVITNVYNGLSDSRNWYSWMKVKDMNHLFLFCPDTDTLYYVKWNV